MPQLWRVAGCAGDGGISVRAESSLAEDRLLGKLAPGAVVREEKMTESGQLLYDLVSGFGPQTGWVTVSANGKDFLIRAVSSPQAEETGEKEVLPNLLDPKLTSPTDVKPVENGCSDPAPAPAPHASQEEGGPVSPEKTPEKVLDKPAETSVAEAPGTNGDSPSKLSEDAPVFVPSNEATRERCDSSSIGLSASAAEFVPGGGDKATDPRVQLAHDIMSQAAANGSKRVEEPADEDDSEDILAQLPWSSQQMLRVSSYEEDDYQLQTPYYVGALKSFNSQKGFGFIMCKQSKEFWGRDVFIHKSQVPVPWTLGQPVEFSIVTNNQHQPQAHDCSWLPLLPGRANQVLRQAPMRVAQTTPASASTAAPSAHMNYNQSIRLDAPMPTFPEPPSMFKNIKPSTTMNEVAQAYPTNMIVAAAAAAAAAAPPPLMPAAPPLMAAAAPPLMPAAWPTGAGAWLSAAGAWPAAAAGAWQPAEPASPAAATTITLAAALPPGIVASEKSTPVAPGRIETGAKEKEPRFLGTVKSFSKEKNYGFVTCDDCLVLPGTPARRDVYFGMSTTPQDWDCTPARGQTAEFSLVYNQEGKPQARKIDWFPVALLPPVQSQKPPVLHESGVRAFQEATLDKLKKLLRLINSEDVGTAIVTAIDYHGPQKVGAPADESREPDIDYVSFVLDRMGSSPFAKMAIKPFVRMLLLLMVSKLARKHADETRTDKLASWLLVLAESINARDLEVQGHIKSVVLEVTKALDENRNIREKELILKALADLQMALPTS